MRARDLKRVDLDPLRARIAQLTAGAPTRTVELVGPFVGLGSDEFVDPVRRAATRIGLSLDEEAVSDGKGGGRHYPGEYAWLGPDGTMLFVAPGEYAMDADMWTVWYVFADGSVARTCAIDSCTMPTMTIEVWGAAAVADAVLSALDAELGPLRR